MTEIKVGDKIKVIHVMDREESQYVGKVFTVSYVNTFRADVTPVYDTVGGPQFYHEEVELFEELKESLTQAIEHQIVFGEVPLESERMDEVRKAVAHSVVMQADDIVHAPSHYVNSGIEPIEYMADKLPAYTDGFTAFCVGNVLKYTSRAPHKHETPLEDLRKAAKYLEFAIEHEEKKRS